MTACSNSKEPRRKTLERRRRCGNFNINNRLCHKQVNYFTDKKIYIINKRNTARVYHSI